MGLADDGGEHEQHDGKEASHSGRTYQIMEKGRASPSGEDSGDFPTTISGFGRLEDAER